VKRGVGDKGRAKATIRYITHWRDRDNQKVTRDLFGFDGFLSKQSVYQMIDEAPAKGAYFYRIILSPDPRREDSYKDLDLRTLTIAAMLRLEERYGKPIQFVAAIHDDHAPHRHVHALVILNGKRLTRADFASLRDYAKKRALTQRRFRDRVRRREYLKERSASYRPPFPLRRRDSAKGRFYAAASHLLSYACPVCGRYAALPFSASGYRCSSCGLKMRRDRPSSRQQPRDRGSGLERVLSL
jgi:DNA-directed RNA polymerase subunit RPC12/RpoP